MDEESEEMLSEDLEEGHREIKNKIALKKIEHTMKIRNRAHGKNKDASEVAEKLEEKGIDTEAFKQRMKS